MSKFKAIKFGADESLNKWDPNKYPEEGIFIVDDITQSDREIIIVNKKSNLTVTLGFYEEWIHTLAQASSPANESLLFKLQVLKLTKAIEDPQYKQLLAMLASGEQVDYQMAEESIKTLLNTKT